MKNESLQKAIKKYRSTKKGRASNLLCNYNYEDLKKGRGKGDLTTQWIVENIFSKPCAHCGETDWTKIGCNRIDNTKSHTKDNVEPCCLKCNNELNYMSGRCERKKIYQYTLHYELVKIWQSTFECEKNGFDRSSIWKCCNGVPRYKTHKGYIWSYTPI